MIYIIKKIIKDAQFVIINYLDKKFNNEPYKKLI